MFIISTGLRGVSLCTLLIEKQKKPLFWSNDTVRAFRPIRFEECTEVSIPLKFLSSSSRILSVSKTHRAFSMTSCPSLSHTGDPGFLDNCWSLRSSEEQSKPRIWEVQDVPFYYEVRINREGTMATGHPFILAISAMEEWSHCFLDTRPPSALERSSVDKDKDSSDRSWKVVPGKTPSPGIKTPCMILMIYLNCLLFWTSPTPNAYSTSKMSEFTMCTKRQNGNPTQCVANDWPPHIWPEQSSLWNCSRRRSISFFQKVPHLHLVFWWWWWWRVLSNTPLQRIEIWWLLGPWYMSYIKTISEPSCPVDEAWSCRKRPFPSGRKWRRLSSRTHFLILTFWNGELQLPFESGRLQIYPSDVKAK